MHGVEVDIFGERSEPSIGRRMENFYVCGVFIRVCMPYFHNPESVRNILRSWLGGGGGGGGGGECCSWKNRHIYADSLNEERLPFRRPKGKKNLSLRESCLVNTCQGKDTGVLFRLKYLIRQHTDTGCVTRPVWQVEFKCSRSFQSLTDGHSRTEQ